ncbi:hypothetical protein H4R33_006222 [Dimargaris cristalligena]|uniref:Uncharacterized protein n=1 Tax=Dimargaris cristalligena TaxID=215637 RepID=A0A4P9ZWF1_9FUNG|nr:hypothetical protein H4R33_006222 [Dimargaris cristalligena]RKP37986.1 hypothetical protein BJ085DRAFT_33588 [Dimargaris cristalligena]|eukprot:RKP37986.1 hypothetical protein BJ085DRAFT_33588 [Dimargaris cristalligena]
MPAAEDATKRKVRQNLKHMLANHSKWQTLCQTGLTFATAAVNARIESTYPRIPTQWPPSLEVFPDLAAQYEAQTTEVAYAQLQALDHIMARLEGVVTDLKANLASIESAAHSLPPPPSSSGSNGLPETPKPIASSQTTPGEYLSTHAAVPLLAYFRIMPLEQWIPHVRHYVSLHSTDLQTRKEILKSISQVATRSTGTTLLSAWLNGIDLDPIILTDFRELVEFELQLPSNGRVP